MFRYRRTRGYKSTTDPIDLAYLSIHAKLVSQSDFMSQSDDFMSQSDFM